MMLMQIPFVKLRDTNVEARAVVVCKDARSIYQIPRTFYEQNVDDLICERLAITIF